MPSAIRLLYTSSADRWRTLLCSKSSSTLRRGRVALSPLSLTLCAEFIAYHYMSMHRALALALALLLGACALPDFMAPYRIDIQQGNYITQEMVSQLKPGMSKEQVRYLL